MIWERSRERKGESWIINLKQGACFMQIRACMLAWGAEVNWLDAAVRSAPHPGCALQFLLQIVHNVSAVVLFFLSHGLRIVNLLESLLAAKCDSDRTVEPRV